MGIKPEKLREIIINAKETLYDTRNLRPHPLRDEKIITSWNGLMISAYAKAGMVLSNLSYIKLATKAAQFILTHLQNEGRLFRIYKDGTATHNAYLDDYAFFIASLLDVYEATKEIHWLEEAIALENTLAARYEDNESGGFYMTGIDHEKMIAREKPGLDGALPSGNSIAADNLIRLGNFTGVDAYCKRLEKLFMSFGNILSSNPSIMSSMLPTVDRYLDTAAS